MARSLDGLIRHLLDQVALCGEHGALPSDLIGYVESYYAQSIEAAQNATGENAISHQTSAPNIDRPFLEQIWKWLTKNSDIRVGDHAGHKHLTLSEVEERNAAIKQLRKSDTARQETNFGQASPALEASNGVLDDLFGHAAQINGSAKSAGGEVFELSKHASARIPKIGNITALSQPPNGSVPNSLSQHGAQNDKLDAALAPSAEVTRGLTGSKGMHVIRLYTSESRMWHALTGHGPDLHKVKPLDFDCLAIIARFGSQGILQHDLTRLSGQDKRSLPSRTDRLHEGGYIVKEQIAVREGSPSKLLHTSRCVLKHLAQFESDQTLKPYPTQADPKSAKKKKKKPRIDQDQKDPSTNGNTCSESRPIPQWTAGRSISNQIFDLVDQFGIQGMSMSDIRDRLFGSNVRKMTEEYVSRLVESWQISQPLHLRHLSIVRDTVLKGKSQIYVYYTFENFQGLVDQERGFWEAVTTVPTDVRKGNNIIAALDAQPDVDDYGFPNLDSNQFAGHSNDLTLREIASALDVGPLPIGIKDPILKQKADSTYAISYKHAERRPTALGDGVQHKVSTSSPSGRIFETPKEMEASHGPPVSVTPQPPTVPKRPLSTSKPPVSAESFLYETPTPKRKYVRKSDKPLGRPRKYPKTGVPENIESMSARDIKQLRDSQEMAEKYEKIQIEIEIVKRIEEGEDPILVADQVLAAANSLRQREGEEPIPEATTSQILFDFAGGPKPDPAKTVGTDWISKLPPAYQRSKTIGRRPTKPLYKPSLAAHSYPTHVPRRRPVVILEPVIEKRVDEIEVLANRTRRKRTPVPDLSTVLGEKPLLEARPVSHVRHVMQYLPSVAAHSWPSLRVPSSNTVAPPNKVPRKRGRPRKQPESSEPQFQEASSIIACSALSPSLYALPTTGTSLKRKGLPKQPSMQPTAQVDIPQYKYLPSISAHSGSFLPPGGSPSKEAGFKRRRGPNKPKPVARDDGSPALGTLVQYKYMPSTAAHSGKFLPPYVPSSTGIGLKRNSVTHSILPDLSEGSYHGWIQFMWKYYEPQLQSISRPCDGIFLGKTMPRRKRLCEPKEFRPKRFKIVVFKSARLKEFEWFVPETAPLASTPNRSRSQSLVLPNAALNTSYHAPTATARRPTRSQPTLPTSISEALMAVRPEPSNLSQSVHVNGVKRKRGDSPQPTLGTPPYAPVSKYSPPRMGSFTDTEKPRLPLELGTLSQTAPSPTPLSRHSPPNLGTSTITEAPRIPLVFQNASRDTPPLAPLPSRSPPKAGPLTATENPTAPLGSANVLSALTEADGDTTIEDEGVRRTPGTPKDMSTHTDDLNLTAAHEPGCVKENIPSPSPKPLMIASQLRVTPEQASGRKETSPQTPTTAVSASQSMAPPTRKSFGSAKKSLGHMSRQGGSSAILRKNIILDLVEKCGGVFPNHREMSQPFAIEWHKKGQEGYPEPKTLQNAVTALCSEERIRRITFTAQTSQGLIVTKDIIALASIDSGDSRVKELQSRMVAAHPRLYLPAAITPVKDPQSLGVQGRKVRNKEGKDVSDSEPATPSRPKLTRRRRRRNSQGELVDLPFDPENPSPNNTKKAPFVPSGLPFRRTGNNVGSTGRVQRLATLQDISNESIPRPPPVPASEAPSTITKALTWLSSEYAFSELNFEEERPTILEPAVMEDTRGRYARYGTRMDPPQGKGSKDPKEQAKRRMREIAENAAKIERHQVQLKSGRPSLLYSDFGSGAKRPSKIGNLKSSFPSRSTSLGYAQSGDAESEDFGSSLGTITFQSAGPETRRPAPAPSPSAPKVVLSWQPTALEEAHETQVYRRSLLVGFMDPVHYFHKHTGTFSVTFAGIGPPRKIVGHRGTCTYPYRAELKTVHPLIGRKYNAILGAAGLHHFAQPPQERFLEEVDTLLKWELDTEGVQDAVVKDWPIINYNFPHSHTTIETIAAAEKAARGDIVRSDDDGPITKSGRRPKGARSPYNKERRNISPAEAHTLNAGPPTNLKRRRLLSVAKKKGEGATTKADSRPTKYRRMRGPRSANYLGQNGEQRLVTAVMVVRTLTGGIEKHIDWILVARVFEPEFDQLFIHGRYSYVQNKFTLMLPKMESDFQDLFAQAYEDGEVPKIDFDNLEAYDWKWLVEWVMAKIDTAFQSQPELPAERNHFQDLYTVKEACEVDNSDFYEFDRMFNTTKRRSAISRSAYIIPLKQERQSRGMGEAEQLLTAKSWVRANIITPKETYDSAAARAKLSIFPENIVEDALKQLLIDKVLMQENKGRLVPGRNYDVSGFFLDRLRKRLLSAHFQRAIAFKRHLDADFAEKGFHPYSYTADDGDVLAVFNLLANKRITAVPINVPMSKWGVTVGGYESRLMDKNRLKFDVELRPLPDYVDGNPLSPYPPPPSQHLQDPNAKIPTWYDIHGSLVPVMWEMALAAIMCILAMRPGAGASEIEKSVKPAMEDWEIESVLRWLVGAKAAKREGTGYSVEEWWWLALGGMEELIGGSDEDTSKDKGIGRANDTIDDAMVMVLDD